MNKKEFIAKMYEAKYAKKLGLVSYVVGFPEPATGDIIVIGLSREELLAMSHAEIEELSRANRTYKAEVLHKRGAKTKKHMRLKFKALELYRFAINSVGGNDRNLWRISEAEFEECRETVGNLKNQKNKGYALELAILGADWDEHHRGVDIENGDIEIKFFNGQIEL